MPVTPTDAALVEASANVLSSGINYAAQSNLNRKTQRWNEMMYGRQRADALADWSMQNAYNTPAAQMQRLKEAGLNPNLVYGNGVQASNADNVRSTESKSWNPQAPDVDLRPMGNSMMSYFNAQQMQLQTNNLQKQFEVMEQEKQLKVAQTLGVISNTDMTRFDLGMKSELKQTTMEAARANLESTLANIERTKASTQFTLNEDQRQAAMQEPNLAAAFAKVTQIAAQTKQINASTDQINQAIHNLRIDARIKEQQAKLWEKGINPGDPAYQRVLMSLVSDLVDWFTRDNNKDPNNVKKDLEFFKKVCQRL